MSCLKDKDKIIDAINFFKERGAIFTSDSDKDLVEKFCKIRSFYFGIDPTGPYLHLGHLSLIISAIHVILKLELNLYIVLGEFTARIGDPSGKTTERKLLTSNEVKSNTASICEFFDCRFKKIIENVGVIYDSYHGTCNYVRVLNNDEWLSKIDLFEFLFTYGKKIKINEMISRDSVKNRLKEETGISFTEFSYQLLQAIDFLHLKAKRGVNVQIGGSDQWGNIITGIDLIKRLEPEICDNVLGITFPLLLNSNGEKFGKTSRGKSLWIHGPDAKPYEIYQHILNCPDSMVDDLINLLTIQEIQKDSEYVELRFYQKEVAKQVIQFLFGESTLDAVLKISDLLFGEKKYSLTKEQVLLLPKDLVFKCSLSNVNKIELCNFLMDNDLFNSKSEFKYSINNNALYINDVKQTKENFHTKVTEDLFKSGSMKISIGKKHKYFAILDE